LLYFSSVITLRARDYVFTGAPVMEAGIG